MLNVTKIKQTARDWHDHKSGKHIVSKTKSMIFRAIWPQHRGCSPQQLSAMMLDATNTYGGQEQELNGVIIQGFLVSKFQRFNDPILPNVHCMLFYIYWTHIQHFRDLIRPIVGICRRPFFPMCSFYGMHGFVIFRNNSFRNHLESSWIFWSILESPKIYKIGFVALM